MKALKSLFEKFSSQERQRSERRPVHGFTAYHWTDSAPKQDEIGDISSTGVYLLTEERWLPGTQVSLTLQRKGPLEKRSERRVTLQAKAVRWGNDGVGLSFALPKDLDSHLWESLLESAGGRKEPDILGQFRMAEALGFLSRICPPATEEMQQLIRGGLGNYRVASAVGSRSKRKLCWRRNRMPTEHALIHAWLCRLLKSGHGLRQIGQRIYGRVFWLRPARKTETTNRIWLS